MKKDRLLPDKIELEICGSNEGDYMKRLRKIVSFSLKGIPVLAAIIVVSLSLVAVFFAAGIKLYFCYDERVSQVPDSGVWRCEELDAEITFGDKRFISLPDGRSLQLEIDYGRHVWVMDPADLQHVYAEGHYTAHLAKGYVTVSFQEYPLSYQEGKEYKFYKIS